SRSRSYALSVASTLGTRGLRASTAARTASIRALVAALTRLRRPCPRRPGSCPAPFVPPAPMFADFTAGKRGPTRYHRRLTGRLAQGESTSLTPARTPALCAVTRDGGTARNAYSAARALLCFSNAPVASEEALRGCER